MTQESVRNVTLTDQFVKDLLTLKRALARWQEDVEAYSTGPITIPLDAGPVVQEKARKVGIPVTSTGICFIITSDADIDTAMTQFVELQSELNGVADTLAEKNRVTSPQKHWWEFWK